MSLPRDPRTHHRPRLRLLLVAVATLAAFAAFAACGVDESLPSGATSADSQRSPAADVVIDASAATVPFDRRLLGTNVPAWIGPERLADPAFRDATVESGVSFVRMPGGSWSNWYDWAGCEMRDDSKCVFVGSARPTDFIDFMQATGLPGMWTLSINHTAQSAAAAVSFFNGELGDERPLGVDRHGVDWGTVNSWAALRDQEGNAEPFRIAMWEVGNEVFGGRPESGGAECASFGWEEVWTCDGAEYIAGDSEHDGYRAIRAAMLAIDPDIQVGAVGVADPAEWSNWGNEVIEGAGSELDFYVVHAYGFDQSPSGRSAVERPAELWPEVVDGVRSVLDPAVPIAVTEHNLVSFEAGDDERTMTTAMNALYLADTIGQFAEGGVAIAAHWNLANGTTGSGTDYGMISLDNGVLFPTYHAMSMWSRAGEELLRVAVENENLRVYATRHEDGRLTVLALNLVGEEMSNTFEFSGSVAGRDADMESVWASDLSDTELSTASSSHKVVDGLVTVLLPPWSISVVEVARA